MPTRDDLLARVLGTVREGATAAGSAVANVAGEAIYNIRALRNEIVRDWRGAIIGTVQQPLSDLRTALFSTTADELANPILRSRIAALGVDPNALQPTATNAEARKAVQRTLAFAAGVSVGGLAASVLPAAATVAGAAGRGAAEMLAFGTTEASLRPLEEGQTRAGTIATQALVLPPLGALGGVTSRAMQSVLQRSGVQHPRLEAPETGSDPSVDPRSIVRTADETLQSPSPPKEIQAVLGAGEITPEEAARRTTEGVAAMEIPTSVRKGPPAPPAPTPAEKLLLGGVPEVKTLPEQPATEFGAAVRQVTAKLSIGERVKAPFTDLYAAFVDDLSPINDAVKRLLRMKGITTRAELTPGVRLPGIDDPSVLASLTRGSFAKANAILQYGPIDWNTLQPVKDIVPLKEIYKRVAAGGPQAIEQFRALLVSPRALELEARGIKQPINAQAAKSVIENAPPDITQASTDAFRNTDAVLQYAVDSGVIPSAQAETWRALNKNYVPFWRFIDTSLGAGPPAGLGAKNTLASVSHGVQRIAGSEHAGIIDPLETLMKNTYAFTSLADRYAVGDALARLAETVPDQQIVRRLTDAPTPSSNVRNAVAQELRGAVPSEGAASAINQVASIVERGTPQANSFWVWRGNQKVHYEVDPQLYRALMDMDRESSSMFMRLMAAPATLEKVGLTSLSPSFAIRNPFFRDPFSAVVFSRFGFTPGYDTIRGIFSALGKDEDYQAFRLSGAEHSTLVRSVSRDRARTQLALNDMLQEQGAGATLARGLKTALNPLAWFNGLRRANELGEEATRIREFARAQSATGDSRLAAFAAREVTIDFARMGYAVKTANQLIPFLNANIQDLDKLVRTFGTEGGRRAVTASANAIAGITLPTIGLYMLNRDDPTYHNLTQARRDFFWNIPLFDLDKDSPTYGQRTGSFLPVPKPFLQGMLFASIPERVMSWMDKRNPKPFDDLASNLFSAATPTVIPAAIQTAVEVAAGPGGYSFFRGGPIVPESEQRLIASEQVGPLQGETVRVLGRALALSPRKVEYVINGYTGNLGGEVLRVADAALRLTQDAPTPGREVGAHDIPIVGQLVRSFLVDEPTVNSQPVRTFYRDWDEISAIMATFRKLAHEPGRADDAKALSGAFRNELIAYGMFVKAQGALQQLRKRIDEIQALPASPALTTDQKEERIKLLGRTYRTIAGRANAAYLQLKQRLDDENAPSLQDTLGRSVSPTPKR